MVGSCLYYVIFKILHQYVQQLTRLKPSTKDGFDKQMLVVYYTTIFLLTARCGCERIW